MPIQAVLFDLDGTLVNTLADVAAAMNAGLEARGLPCHETKDYAPWISEGVEDLATRALVAASPPGAFAALHDGDRRRTVAAFIDDYRVYYAAHMLDRSRPYPGVRELLDALDARRVPTAVLTNKAQPAATAMVEALFPGRFRAVVGQRPDVPPKPDPRSALELCAALGVAPNEALLLGDSEIDVRTARAAGLRAIACTWGFRSREALLAEAPDGLIDRPEALLVHVL
jgi:phosphoglycolate phosphatase